MKVYGVDSYGGWRQFWTEQELDGCSGECNLWFKKGDLFYLTNGGNLDLTYQEIETDWDHVWNRFSQKMVPQNSILKGNKPSNYSVSVLAFPNAQNPQNINCCNSCVNNWVKTIACGP